MNILQLVLTICLYIISLVLAMILAMVSRRWPGEKIRLPLALHALLLLLAVVFGILFKGADWTGYFLILTVCSGLALSGWAIRNKSLAMPWRLYLALYLLSIVMFLWSPSQLFYLISGNSEKYRKEQQFHLGKNYWLVEQNSMFSSGKEPAQYKFIQKYGIYNKTWVRNIDFGQSISKVSKLQFSEDTLVLQAEVGDSVITAGFKPGMKKNRISKGMK